MSFNEKLQIAALVVAIVGAIVALLQPSVRRVNRVLATLLLVGVGAWLGVTIVTSPSSSSKPIWAVVLMILIVVVFLSQFFKSFFAFLEPTTHSVPRSDENVANFRERLVRLEELASTSQWHSSLNEETTTTLVDSLTESIKTRAHTELIADLRESIGQDDTIADMDTAVRSTLSRLASDHQTLARRSNINLFVGLLTTAIGIGYLIIGSGAANVELLRHAQEATLAGKTPSITIADYLVAYAPRISLVVVVEVFAYFFLTLYKTGVADVKYVQNEITTVEMRVLALVTAIRSGDTQATTSILQALGGIDRNAGLNSPPGESQSSSERAKLLEIVKELISTAKK